MKVVRINLNAVNHDWPALLAFMFLEDIDENKTLWATVVRETYHVNDHLSGDLPSKCCNGDGLAIRGGFAGHELSRVRLMVDDLKSLVSI